MENLVWLCEWGVGSQVGTPLEPRAVKGLWSQQWKSVVLGV